MAKKLKKLTQAEFNVTATMHLAFLAGDKNSRADFSYCDFTGIDLRNVDLSGANFQGSDLSHIWQNHYMWGAWNMEGLVINGADFSKVILPNLSFEMVKVDGLILIWAKFDQKQFTLEQKKKLILTEEQLKIKAQQETIEKQEEILEQVWEDYSSKLKSWFSGSHRIFKEEETTWLKIAILMFIILILASFFPIISALEIKQVSYIVLFFLLMVVVLIIVVINAVTSSVSKEETRFETFARQWSGVFSFALLFLALLWIQKVAPEKVGSITIAVDNMYPFIPFDLICIVFLYFCVSQYTKAKALRIEFQNKLAIIDGYMGLTAQLWTAPERRLDAFLPNISDVLFTKVLSKWEKESNLPVDEILKIVELVTKKK